MQTVTLPATGAKYKEPFGACLLLGVHVSISKSTVNILSLKFLTYNLILVQRSCNKIRQQKIQFSFVINSRKGRAAAVAAHTHKHKWMDDTRHVEKNEKVAVLASCTRCIACSCSKHMDAKQLFYRKRIANLSGFRQKMKVDIKKKERERKKERKRYV
jgi:hypothetical protein